MAKYETNSVSAAERFQCTYDGVCLTKHVSTENRTDPACQAVFVEPVSGSYSFWPRSGLDWKQWKGNPRSLKVPYRDEEDR